MELRAARGHEDRQRDAKPHEKPEREPDAEPKWQSEREPQQEPQGQVREGRQGLEVVMMKWNEVKREREGEPAHVASCLQIEDVSCGVILSSPHSLGSYGRSNSAAHIDWGAFGFAFALVASYAHEYCRERYR